MAKEENTPKNSNEELFNRLIEEEKEDKRKQDSFLKKQKSKKTRGKKIAIVSFSTLALLIAATLALYDPFTGAIRWGDGPDQVKKGNTVEIEAGATEKQWNKTSGNFFPEATEKWEETFYLDMKNAAMKEAMASYAGLEFMEFSHTLPSEAAGFTSDDSQAELDGGINPLYSYWTQESFAGETSLILQRLLNPIYGGWNSLQFNAPSPEENVIDRFNDIFTEEWMKNNEAKNLPIFVDWENYSYGVDGLFDEGDGYRWLGNVTSTTSEATFDIESSQYTVNLKADIIFSAWTKNKEKIEKTGVLTLELVANSNNRYSSSNNKVLINSASLVVN